MESNQEFALGDEFVWSGDVRFTVTAVSLSGYVSATAELVVGNVATFTVDMHTLRANALAELRKLAEEQPEIEWEYSYHRSGAYSDLEEVIGSEFSPPHQWFIDHGYTLMRRPKSAEWEEATDTPKE